MKRQRPNYNPSPLVGEGMGRGAAYLSPSPNKGEGDYLDMPEETANHFSRIPLRYMRATGDATTCEKTRVRLSMACVYCLT